MNLYNTNPYAYAMPQHNSITWVQGVEGAKAWQLSPNSTVLLMDSENDGIFYIKSSDNVGMCGLRTFKYEEITQKPSSVDLSDYVKKSELESLINSMLGGATNESTVSATNGKSVITE